MLLAHTALAENIITMDLRWMDLLSHALILSLLSCTTVFGQFPSVCNTPQSLDTKTCCPNDCNGNGKCESINELASSQLECANPEVVEILQNAPNVPEKGTADARYRWPTVVFENVCVCSGNFWGPDCSECAPGWTADDCEERKTPVICKNFAHLSLEEKQTFVDATQELKKETGRWSVVVKEPANYSTGTVTLQNVSTYDFFVYLHDYVARDDRCENMGITINFAHAGPTFPVWHRRYMLTVEREFQRITNNASFGFPYWQWEQDDKSMFDVKYYGVPSNSTGPRVNVSGDIINPEKWNTICDITYQQPGADCQTAWKPCNPANDLAEKRPLQRGGRSAYLPNAVEVMIAIAAPSYDAADDRGQYFINDSRTSFRSRLEGWNMICSAVNCIGYNSNSSDTQNDHMHNVVHDWVGGQMDYVPAAVNDPVFNLHHCNVDRILESWMQRFANGKNSPTLLPAYVPVCGGHPGHNRKDFLVPFFPLITAGQQYRVAEEWGYVYDELVKANIADSDIPNCFDILAEDTCPICNANGVCIDCTDQSCPLPTSQMGPLTPDSTGDDDLNYTELALGLGLGIPLAISIIIIFILLIIALKRKSKSRKKDSGGGNEMTNWAHIPHPAKKEKEFLTLNFGSQTLILGKYSA